MSTLERDASVRGKTAPGSFPDTVGDEITAKAATKRAAGSSSIANGWHVDALELLALHVRSQPATNQAIVALHLWNSHQTSEWNRWVPGPEQLKVIASLGYNGCAPDPRDTLTELATAAMEDLAKQLQDKLRHADADAQRGRAAVAKTALAEQRAQDAEAALKPTRSELAHTKQLLAKTQEELAFYMAREDVEPHAPADAPTEPKQRKRRAKIEGLAGVMLTERADDTVVYEVLAPDPDQPGKRKWFQFDGSEAAVQFRDAQRGGE